LLVFTDKNKQNKLTNQDGEVSCG